MSQQNDPTKPWAHLLGEYRYLPKEDAVLFSDGRKMPWESVYKRLTGGTAGGPGQASGQPKATQPSSSRTTISTFTNRASGQETKIESGEATQLTPPELQKASIQAHRRIVQTRSNKANTKYKVQKNPQAAFKFGNVIELLYPAESSDGNSTVEAAGNHESEMRVRRFAIIEPGRVSSAALAINMTRPGIVLQDHAIIYTGPSPPSPMQHEAAVRLPNSEVDTLRPDPVEVIPEQNGTALDSMSRLNLREHYVIDHGNEVHVFGSVAPNSMNALRYQFRDVTTSPSRPPPPTRSRPEPQEEDPQIVQLAVRVRAAGRQHGEAAAAQALANCKQHDERNGTNLYPRLIAYLQRTAHLQH